MRSHTGALSKVHEHDFWQIPRHGASGYHGGQGLKGREGWGRPYHGRGGGVAFLLGTHGNILLAIFLVLSLSTRSIIGHRV